MTDFAIDIAAATERTTPISTSGSVKVYTKDVSGVTHAFAIMGDGTEVQITPAAFSSGSLSYAKINSFITIGPHDILNQSAPQNTFDNSTITLESGMTYHLKGKTYLLFPISTNAVGVNLCFTGSVIFASFDLQAWGVSANANIAYMSSSASVTLCPSATANRKCFIYEGNIVVSASGTFGPQVSFTGVPGTTGSVLGDSFCELIPLSASFIQQGGWN